MVESGASRLRIVSHEEYIPPQYLPTFNSNVIELWLHSIPDLGEQFVLFNDDMYLTAPVASGRFFPKGGSHGNSSAGYDNGHGSGGLLPATELNNFALINSHFNKKDVLRKHGGKFFSMRLRRKSDTQPAS